eukprot:CAMPEP_0197642756 /NCGR_PEP_ID=MMETSP1338-20131121/16324_1 /TAXON_ID=43686 ORGANISM="Pelagodinium beii, Strain RCC1491" /NCGR_SAMPLE_ID=MMETSP1338 /ASSEMBLY_ACC=CAM_ASM_000754 /LENGTH=144 /DNA_ID=CAMNT_0043215925 /DNA_START=41 /DNA_END=472 /DNA_ORIENTATION=-
MASVQVAVTLSGVVEALQRDTKGPSCLEEEGSTASPSVASPTTTDGTWTRKSSLDEAVKNSLQSRCPLRRHLAKRDRLASGYNLDMEEVESFESFESSSSEAEDDEDEIVQRIALSARRLALEDVLLPESSKMPFERASDVEHP